MTQRTYSQTRKTPFCSSCVVLVPDKDKEPETTRRAGQPTVWYPTKPDQSGLCYFHKKLADGLFDVPTRITREGRLAVPLSAFWQAQA